ncbi:cell division protein FtsH [Lachnospiraceae bacterium KM106-2]|nr:cell division protein FtsH [Lachnospiraceae bacterium KM106-2]
MKIGFDNDKYLSMQSEHIRERISKFGNKLYLEFGGKLFDDYHASRVLPGFQPDSKLRMLLQLKEQAEIVIVIGADSIEQNKIRGDLGITYDLDVLRLIEMFEGCDLMVGSVVITKYAGQASADKFRERLTNLGIKSYLHFPIEGYPSNVANILSENGFGKNEYVETSRPLVVVTAPGPGSGKMATCLSQLYHENKRGIEAGYAKFETFPIWNLPLKHPVNLAYEAATADLNDINMIDPFHLEAYGEATVNYNRDVEIFPVLNGMFEKIMGESPYKSPTDMGVNMAGYCIIDDEVCKEASTQEIIRRYYQALADEKKGIGSKDVIYKLELLMKQAHITIENRQVIADAIKKSEETHGPAVAIELSGDKMVTGKTSPLLGSCAAALLNALKELAGIDHDVHLVSPMAIEPIQALKTKYLGSSNPRLHSDEILIALSASAATDENARRALEQLPKLRGCEAHSSVFLPSVDMNTLKKLGIHLTCEPVAEDKKYIHL